MAAVSDTDTGHGAEGLAMVLSQCRLQSWCGLPAAIFKTGLAPCNVCATPGSPLASLTEAQFNAASVNPTPPPAQFTGPSQVLRSRPRTARRPAAAPAIVPRDRTGPR